MTSKKLEISGWRTGAQTIGAMKVLARETGCSMHRAKKDIERVLGGEKVAFHLEAAGKETAIVKELEELGFVAEAL